MAIAPVAGNLEIPTIRDAPGVIVPTRGPVPIIITFSGDNGSVLGLIRLGLFTETIADAAAQIAEVVLRGIEPHPVLKMAIEEAEKSVVRVTVPKKSKLIGQAIKEANIPEETGMWILAIRRGNRWIRPRPRVVIEAKDTLIASGYADGEEDFIKLIKG